MTEHIQLPELLEHSTDGGRRLSRLGYVGDHRDGLGALGAEPIDNPFGLGCHPSNDGYACALGASLRATASAAAAPVARHEGGATAEA